MMLKKELTAKERLFCTYYCLGRNGREAAAKSGYRLPERASVKLLKKDEVKAFIRKTDLEEKSRKAEIAAGYRRLAFGCITDAVRLVYEDEPDALTLEGLDLFMISDIKKPKGGGIEIKFFDRLKALEKLENLSASYGEDSASSLYSAIEKGAKALRDSKNE